jgi:hypothetical protein
MHRPYTSSLIAVLLAAAIAPAVAATTYVMVSDRHLVTSSTAVVEARVLAAEPESLGGLPATRYHVEVEELLSGDVRDRQLVVDVPGGVAGDVGLRLDGMPSLAAGERVLLFLDERGDGSYRVTQLLLGVFRERFEAGRRVWARDHLGQARELAASGTGPANGGFHRSRDAEAFGRWIEETGRGGEPEDDYFVATGGGAAPGDERATGAYRLSQSDHPLRWFGFDEGEPVLWNVAAGGQPGYTPEATVAAFRTALAAWNHDPESIVDMRYGAAGDGRGFQFRDDVNSLLFADADGSIGDPYDCGAGGILAVGGPWYDPTARQDPRGMAFQPILEAEIVTNRGIECYLASQSDPARALGQLLAHELGHALGIAHSCSGGGDCTAAESDALMYPYLHADGRGAELGGDDRAAVRHLYPGRSGPDELEEGPGECSDPEVLCLHGDRFRVEVGWRSQHQAGREGRGRAVPGTGESGYFWFFGEDNVELVVKVLDGRPVNGNFWVFYGGLSDVEYEIEVWDTATGVRRAYRNEPGELCGDADTTAFADAGAAAQSAAAAPAAAVAQPATVLAAASQGTCVPSAATLCLQDGRFAVTVDWRNQRTGNTGAGQVLSAAVGGEKTGYFWFFRPQNVELVVKLIDGREVNGKHWFFYGALSDVEYEIEVRDTLLGGTRTYRNEPGSICGRGDTAAF